MSLTQMDDATLRQELGDAISHRENVEAEFKRRADILEAEHPALAALMKEGVDLLMNPPSVFIVERLCPHCGKAVERVR